MWGGRSLARIEIGIERLKSPAVAAAFDLAGRMGIPVVNASLGANRLSMAQRAAIDAHPTILWVIVRLLARRLRNTDESLADAVFLDVPARTAKRLLEIAGDVADRTRRSARTVALKEVRA